MICHQGFQLLGVAREGDIATLVPNCQQQRVANKLELNGTDLITIKYKSTFSSNLVTSTTVLVDNQLYHLFVVLVNQPVHTIQYKPSE